MNLKNYCLREMLSRAATIVPLLLLLIGGSQQAEAQYVSRWINIGSLHSQWSQMGLWSPQGFPANSSPIWEGIEEEVGWGYGAVDEIGVENIRGLGGEPGPITESISFRGRDAQRHWPKLPFRMVSKRPQTEVTVDGLSSFNRPSNIDEVDPTMNAHRMVEATYGTWMGVDRTTRIYAYGSQPHDDYYIVEMTLQNTGNTDQDEEIELERTLEGVRFARRRNHSALRYVGYASYRGYRWGSGNDGARTLETIEDHPDYDIDFTSLYTWIGWQDSFSEWNTIGGPIMRKNSWVIAPWDTVGRLAGGGMMGTGEIYAPERTMSADESPWQVPDAGDAQPHGTRYQGNENEDGLANFWGYDGLESGHLPNGWWQSARECPQEQYPGLTWEQRMSQCESNSIRTLSREYMSYGPYDLEPGEKITIVEVVSATGLNRRAKFEIGRKNKRRWEREEPLDTPLEFDANQDGEITDTEQPGAEGDEVMSKNMWVFSSRDSLFTAMKNARAVWQAELDVPERPVRPASFDVSSQPDRIELSWSLFEDAPVPDSFAVYRTDGAFRQLHHQVATVAASQDQRQYTYADTDVERGVGYYYYLQAIDQTEESPAGVTEVGTTLRSNRYATQTYTSARLLRGPGQDLAAARVVPNPLNVNASASLRYPNQENRIGFLDIPGQCTIRIYTELGELVRTLEHTTGSGDEYWNLTTESNQVAQTGIYLAVIEDHETGEQIVRRFVIIR